MSVPILSFSANTLIQSAQVNSNFANLQGAVPWSTNPIAAAGDLIVGSASGTATSLSKGSNGQVLTVSGGNVIWGSLATSNLSVVSKTSGYTATSADDIILCSSSAFNITLPDASSNAGKQLVIKKTDTGFSNVISILPVGSDNIEGLSQVKLYSGNEAVTLVALPGANWSIIEHKCPSQWVSYTPTITGFGSTSNILFYYRREGDSIRIRGSATTSSGGSGKNTISLPSGLTIDSAKIGTNLLDVFGGFHSVTAGANNIYANGISGVLNPDLSLSNTAVYFAFTTTVSLFDANSSGFGQGFQSEFLVPITNWLE